MLNNRIITNPYSSNGAILSFCIKLPLTNGVYVYTQCEYFLCQPSFCGCSNTHIAFFISFQD